MAYIADKPNDWLTDPPKSVGDGQCVAFVKAASGAPETKRWTKGAPVKANPGLTVGTAIATFDSDGTYGNHQDGRSHAAIYMGQDAHGLRVMDQWMTPIKDAKGKITGHKPQPVHLRTIRFWHKGAVTPNNDGNCYNVIE